MPLFTPPTVKRPVGRGPLMSRYSYDKGISVVFVNGQYRAVPYPETETLLALEDGVTYFMGGHGPYQVDEATAEALQAAGFEIELDPVDPGPKPGAPTIVSGDMQSETTATVTIAPATLGAPAISYKLYRDGVLVDVITAPSTTFQEAGLPTASPTHPTFVFTVKAENEVGESDTASNSLTLQWQGVDPPPPPPPPPPQDEDGFGEGVFGSGPFGDPVTAPPTDDTFGSGPFGDGPFGDQ